MNLLSPLAAFLGLEVGDITDRIKRAIILNAVMGVFAALTVIFLLVSGFVALAAKLGAIYAALIFAGVFFIVTLGIFVAMKIDENARKRRVTEKRRSTETSAFVTTAALTALPMLLRSPIVRNIGIPLAAAAGLAILIGKRHDDNLDV